MGGSNIQRFFDTGYTFTFANSAISWSSRKRRCVVLSSSEAEYIALSEEAEETIYLKRILEELTGTDEPVLVRNNKKCNLFVCKFC